MCHINYIILPYFLLHFYISFRAYFHFNFITETYPKYILKILLKIILSTGITVFHFKHFTSPNNLNIFHSTSLILKILFTWTNISSTQNEENYIITVFVYYRI